MELFLIFVEPAMNGTILHTHNFIQNFLVIALNFQCTLLKVKEVESEREVNIPNLHSSDKGFVQEHMKARRVKLLEMVFEQ